METWEKIKQVGQLGAEDEEHFKTKVERAIEHCKRNMSASKLTLDRVEQLRGSIDKTLKLAEELILNDEFHYAGTYSYDHGGPEVDVLVEAAEALAKLDAEMERVQARFRDARDYRPVWLEHIEDYDAKRGKDLLGFDHWDQLSELAWELLMIQAHSRGKAPPVVPHETALNPRFEELVYLCAKAADPHLIGDCHKERNYKIDRALKNATLSYRIIRDYDPDGWDWNWN